MKESKINIVTTMEFLDEKYSEASVGQNPLFQWAKIIITDDKPNLNKQRVPIEEFDNIIRTGYFTPIKMAEGGISDGHKDAFGKVIGTITNITKDNDKIIALAALWKSERPEDISLLKSMYLEGRLPNVSWELLYSSSEVDDDGVSTLRGLTLAAATVVGRPAYGGRTPVIAMSSVTEEEEVEEKDLTKITELESTVASLQEAVKTQEAELVDLRKYKDEIEREKANAARLVSIKNKFVEAGITKSEEYFSEKASELLVLSDESISFMIQEMVAFKPKESSEASDKNPKVPNIVNSAPKQYSASELGRMLRESK